MSAVFVLDGEQRAALAVVRSLGRTGERVYVASSHRRSIAGSSRYATATAVTPDPLDSPAAYADAVVALAKRWRTDVLLPITDASMLATLPRRAQLDPIKVPFPEAEVYARAANKTQVLAAAHETGIAVPAQLVLESASSVLTAPLGDLPYPVVAKPSRSVVGSEAGRVKVGVTYAEDADVLRRQLRTYPTEAYPLLVQQRVTGAGSGVFLLLWDGELFAAFAHRRLREKPPSGGVSVYRESVPLDSELLESSRRLLDHLGWSGVAMIEFKVDAATGTPYLMEINGRLWGSLQLAVDAGVDFPQLLLRLARGERPSPVMTYRVGVRSRWWWGDVDHVLARIRRSDAALSLPPGTPTRPRAVLEFLRFARTGDRSEVFRFHDPMPFVRETMDWLREF